MAGQNTSKWLRAEGDADWEERIGRENNFSKSTGGNNGEDKMEVSIRRDLRRKGYEISAISGSEVFQKDLTGNPRDLQFSNTSTGPREDESIRLNIEGRKRSRSGHETNVTMDTEGALQIAGFAAIDYAPLDATLSNVDCSATVQTDLATLAKQAS